MRLLISAFDICIEYLRECMPDPKRQIRPNQRQPLILQRPGKNMYCKNYDVTVAWGGSGTADMVMTSVMGHLMAIDFPAEYKSWHSVGPQELFHSAIIKSVPP